jgi:predicted Zn-dependent peptidase
MNYKLLLTLLLVSVLSIQCSKKTVPMVEEVDQTWRSQIPQPGEARSIELGDYQSFDLANGLKVIVVENHKLPRVSYQIALKNDPILEGNKAGYVSMAGSLMSTGTVSKSKAEIDKAIDFIGANLNTSGSGIFGSSLTKHQDKLLSLMTDVLYNPSFPEEEFQKLRTQTLSGLTASKADPNSIASNVASAVNYGTDHPYGEIQTEVTTNAFTIDDCKKYYERYFVPNNAYLVIVGDISLNEAQATANQYFGSWKKGPTPGSSYKKPEPPQENSVRFANKDGAVQAVIRVTHPVELKPGSEDVVKVSVMNSILGGGVFLGRLMQNLREDKGYTYGARSSLSSDPLAATFNASASVRNEVADSSITEFLYEIKRMTTEPVSSKDLQLAKNSMAGSFARALESPQTLARFAINTFRYDLPKDYYATYLSRLDAVTEADVQMAAKKYLRPDATNIVVVGSKDDVAEKLIQFDADGEIDYYGPFGNKLEMKENPIPEGITAETIINDYIEAIGGEQQLRSVKTVKNEMKMSIMGQEAQVTLVQKEPLMLSLSISMSGMTLQEQKFNGEKAMNAAMGNKQVFTEGPEFDALKAQAEIFPQLSYKNYDLELVGIEEIEGVTAYKIIVTLPSGKSQTDYYDITTNLLIRTVSTQAGPGGQGISVISDISDYQEAGGVMIPRKVSISGATPQPMTMESVNLSVNGPVDDALFNIE